MVNYPLISRLSLFNVSAIRKCACQKCILKPFNNNFNRAHKTVLTIAIAAYDNHDHAKIELEFTHANRIK